MPRVPTMMSTSPSRPASRDGPAALGPEHAGRVRLVDHHPRVVAAGEVDDALERRDVAVHREHAVGHDQASPPARLAQPPLEVVGVEVVVDERLRSRQPAPVDDAGVVEGVGEDDVALLRERADHAHVGEVARAEQQAALAALELGQPLLQPAVQRHVPRYEPRGARADPVAHRRVRGCLPHLRVVGEAEVVVRAQQQHALAVEQHARPLRAGHHAHAAVEAQTPAAPRDGRGSRSRLGPSRKAAGRAAWRIGGRLALLAEPQLRRGVPEVRLGL